MDLDYYFMLKENKSKFTVAGIVLVPVFLYLASIWRRPFFAPLEYNGAAVADALCNFMTNGTSLLVPKVADATLLDYPVFSYYLSAFFQSVLGKSTGSIRLAFVVVVLLTAWVLWKGLKDLVAKETSLVASCLFISMLMPFFTATFANSGAWGGFYTLCGAIFLAKGSKDKVSKKSYSCYFFISGLFSSLGLLFYGLEIPVILFLGGIIGFLLLKDVKKLFYFLLFDILGFLPLTLGFILMLKTYEPAYLQLLLAKYQQITLDSSILDKLGLFLLGTLPPGLFIVLIIRGYSNKVKEFFLNPAILMLSSLTVVAFIVGLLSNVQTPLGLSFVYPLVAIFMAQGLVYFSSSSANMAYCNRIIKKMMIFVALLILAFFIYHVLGIFFNVIPQSKLIFTRGEAYYLPILVSLIFLFWLYFAYTEEKYVTKFGCIVLGCFCLFSMAHSFIPLKVVIKYAPIRFLEKSLESNLEPGNLILADSNLLGAVYWHLPKYTVKFIECNTSKSLVGNKKLSLNTLEDNIKNSTVPVWLLSKKGDNLLKKSSSVTEVIALHNKVFSAKLLVKKSARKKAIGVKRIRSKKIERKFDIIKK